MDLPYRVLVWARGRDGPLTCEVLGRSGFAALAVDCGETLAGELERGAGALVLASECLNESRSERIRELLHQQPPWSELPVLVVTDNGPVPTQLAPHFAQMSGVTVLHRPLSLDTLRSSIATALRARRRQYEVRDLLAQQTEASRRRDEFLAMLAHELRNPLSAIRNGLQVLQLTESLHTASRVRSMMERQSGHLARLIEDLLDVARITQGKIRLQKRPVDVPELLRQVAEGRAQAAAEKGISVSVAAADPGDGPLLVPADPMRLEQMIDNVLGNALKFTPARGRISLEARHCGCLVEIRVTDSGIGIPAHALRSVFDLFAQGRQALDRSAGGLGIGLTVVRSLAELHGGSVEALSPGEGQGTQIIIRLPARDPQVQLTSAEPPARPGLGPAPQSRKVLLVEDNRDTADSLAAYLRTCGHTVHVAYDGPAGLRTAVRERPDAIVCDIGLPGMDGYKLAALIRAEPELHDCLLLAVTGYGSSRDRERGEQAGFHHYLVKPADPTTIVNLLAQVPPEALRGAGGSGGRCAPQFARQ